MRFLEFIIHKQQYQFMDIWKSFDFRPVGELAENGETLRWLLNHVLERPSPLRDVYCAPGELKVVLQPAHSDRVALPVRV